jgi:hypothetical protein
MVEMGIDIRRKEPSPSPTVGQSGSHARPN